VFVCYYKSWSTKNTFQSKKNLTWFPGKCFPFWLCLFFGKWFPRNHFPNFPVFVCHKKSWWTENTFQSKKNLAWFSGKCFLEKFGRKTLSGSCEKFRNIIICWLYQIWFSNFCFEIFIFQFHHLKFNFYINFDPYFYNCYLFFSYHFFIEIFYLSNLILILLIVTYFIWNNLWNVDYYYFNFFIFHFFFNFLDLISIILIIVYFIWDNLWNYIFF